MRSHVYVVTSTRSPRVLGVQYPACYAKRVESSYGGTVVLAQTVARKWFKRFLFSRESDSTTPNVRSFVRSLVCLSESKTPKQL